MKESKPLRTAFLAMMCMLQMQAAEANTPAPPDMKSTLRRPTSKPSANQLRNAPIHLQALIVDEPAFFSPNSLFCVVTASVVRSFKGWSVLPPGSLFRVHIPCSPGGWHVAEPIHVRMVSSDELKIGRYFEAFIQHFAPPNGYRLAGYPTEQSTAPEERFAFVSVPTLSPYLLIPPAPSTDPEGPLHFWPSSQQLNIVMREQAKGPERRNLRAELPALTLDLLAATDRGLDHPPAFPTEYVAQTITHRDKPDRRYRILYDPNSWRTRVEELDASGQATGLVQYGDAFAGIMINADAGTHTLVQTFEGVSQHGQNWRGTGWLGLSPIVSNYKLDPGSQKIIAGTLCTTYRAVTEIWNPHRFRDNGHICITQEGMDLEIGFDPLGGQRFVTIKVEHLDQSKPAEFDPPRNWPIRNDLRN